MISIIIVNFFSADLTKRAVNSLLGEHEEVEIFVVDNTCTAAERRILNSLFPQDVNLVFNDTNEGFARACNKAFAASRGEFIFLLNPDAYLLPSCLGKMRDCLSENPHTGAVSPQVFWDDELTYYFPVYPLPSPFHDFLSRMSLLSHWFLQLYSLHARRKNLLLWKSQKPIKVRNLSGGAVMLRRAAVEKSGGLFDERFFLFYEDTDLFLRLRKSGFDLSILPHAQAVHNHVHKREKLDIMAESCLLYFEKHFSDSLFRKATSLLRERQPKPEYAEHGSWSGPPLFQVPLKLQKDYLFEWSPAPFFVPSVGYFGNGKQYVFSQQIWNQIDKGEYFSRFSDPSELFLGGKIFRWYKD